VGPRLAVAPPYLEAAAVLRHEDVLVQRRERLIIKPLLVPIVALGARAQHLDNDLRVRGVRRRLGISLHGAADDGDIGVGRDVRFTDPNPEV
jgi:hypothetical protein